MYKNQKQFSLGAALLVLLCGACSSAVRKDERTQLQVYRIDAGMSNVYLLKGAKVVMVDTGLPTKQQFVEEQIRSLGIRPEDISLIVVTHGHRDHSGNARYFQEKFKIPVAGGAGDLDKFTGGRTDLAKAESIGLMARMIRGGADKPYPAFQPDVVVDREIPLAKYGIPGKLMPLPGHTPGSVVVIADDAAFVGDLIRGGVIFTGSPTEHFFHENRSQARAQLRTLAHDGIRVFYPGHFGPLQAEDIASYNAE